MPCNEEGIRDFYNKLVAKKKNASSKILCNGIRLACRWFQVLCNMVGSQVSHHSVTAKATGCMNEWESRSYVCSSLRRLRSTLASWKNGVGAEFAVKVNLQEEKSLMYMLPYRLNKDFIVK